MRAGYTGSQKYSTMMWAGDQNVDWSLDDGLASVVPAALSLAMTGHGLHHSDIGGYTTLFDMKRSKELLLRWCDFSAFTPMMRTTRVTARAITGSLMVMLKPSPTLHE